MNKISFVHTSEHSYNYVKSLFRDLCTNASTVVSKKLLKMSDSDLSSFDISPRDYSNPSDFLIDYSLVKYLSKWKGLKTGLDTSKIAILAFEQQEIVNKAVNRRLAKNATSIVDPILHRASRLCAKILGDFNIALFDGLEDWGPGATTDASRRRAQYDSKISNFPIPVTYEAREVLERVIVNDLHWSFTLLGDFPAGPFSMLSSCFIITNSSRIDTVPKSSRTDRTIAIEPRGNMFLQKGVGSFIRRKLLRYGVNLNDQSRNQTLAGLAKDLQLATIDLSMASDSITTELVWLLLPFEWAAHLDRIRSKYYLSFDQKSNLKFEKFSSMGNGFTFELESLIFFALVKACQDDDEAIVAIYGDDIICPQNTANLVISTLNYCGFSINENKSYIEGNFFESCGSHYFNGVYVTPVYQKENVLDDFEALRFFNRIARFLIRSYSDGDKLLGPWCEPWRLRVKSVLRSHDAPCIPFGTQGDEGLLVNHSLVVLKKYKRSYGYQWKTLSQVPVFIPANEAALLALTFRRGVVTEQPFNGDLPSRSEKGLIRRESTKWIEPPWEFALD